MPTLTWGGAAANALRNGNVLASIAVLPAAAPAVKSNLRRVMVFGSCSDINFTPRGYLQTDSHTYYTARTRHAARRSNTYCHAASDTSFFLRIKKRPPHTQGRSSKC